MPAPDGRKRLLILGGTGEARALAEALADDGIDLVNSLAGSTRSAAALPGRLRVGGFGGAAGLAAYLAAEAIDLVVDATHPFSTTISANAASACAAAAVPRLALTRSEWRAGPGDRWIAAADAAEAAMLLPRHGRRAFLAIGRRELAAFAHLDEMWFLVRLVDVPETALPLPDCQVVAARGPFGVVAERRLLEEHAIDAIVCKASGGTASAAKLAAARVLGLPVVMLRRPPPPPAPTVAGLDAALAAIRAALDLSFRGHETQVP
jgi:precorrin-6A/cobalt-precorrin-6A reductase